MPAEDAIKILHVVFSLDPGGMENGLVNVANALPGKKFETHVCCLIRPGAFASRLPDSNLVYSLHKPEGFSPSTVLKLIAVIRKVKPHIIHSHNLGPLIYSSLATGFGLWKPIVHGEHGSLQPDQLTFRRIASRKFFFRTCRRIHTVSHTLTAQLREMGLPDSRLVTLINGVDTSRFAPPASRHEARLKVGLPPNAIVIGIVARLVALKRHADLIRAFELIADEFPRSMLLIVGGGGPEEGKIISHIQSSPVKDRIRAVGFQSDPLPFYQAMDLLTVPSLHEGMSNVVLEAMSTGVPVLAHNVCGNAEMISHGIDGLVGDLATVEKLQKILEIALKSPENLASMGEQARAKVSKEFSLASMVRNYEMLYSELLRAANI